MEPITFSLSFLQKGSLFVLPKEGRSNNQASIKGRTLCTDYTHCRERERERQEEEKMASLWHKWNWHCQSARERGQLHFSAEEEWVGEWVGVMVASIFWEGPPPQSWPFRASSSSFHFLSVKGAIQSEEESRVGGCIQCLSRNFTSSEILILYGICI